jgi:hypothetical protein
MTDPHGSEHECGKCHEVFSGLTLFDRHQDVDYRREPSIICRAPAALGLVQDGRGTWCTPEGLKSRDFHATRLARANRGRARLREDPDD